MLDMNANSVARPVSSSRQHWLMLGLILLFAGVSIQYSVKVFGGHANWRSAFLRWRPQIIELVDGEDVYLKHNYPNAPIMPLLLAPLAFLPEALGSLCWFYLKVGITLLSITWAFRLIETPERFLPSLGENTRHLVEPPTVHGGDLSHGNVNLYHPASGDRGQPFGGILPIVSTRQPAF